MTDTVVKWYDNKSIDFWLFNTSSAMQKKIYTYCLQTGKETFHESIYEFNISSLGSIKQYLCIVVSLKTSIRLFLSYWIDDLSIWRSLRFANYFIQDVQIDAPLKSEVPVYAS